jgi:cytochrome c oxidase cbb3-type subunit 3/ubiquinol-cytochrome c reductase cytochrome c subunit
LLALPLFAGSLTLVGCNDSPGKPGPGPEVPRPDRIVDFATLYKQNCVACHGDNGQPGAAIPLYNPVYLAIAGEDNIRSVIGNGVPGKLMPAFGKNAGGMLTEQQVDILAKGLISTWGKPGALEGKNPPPYKATQSVENSTVSQQAYATYCARCHGADGQGAPAGKTDQNLAVGSIVDPAYLGLISNQNLRSIIIAGVPGMPDWRGEGQGPAPARPMSDEEVTGVVAWLASHRNSSQAPSGPATGEITAPSSDRTAQTSGTKRQEPHS